MATQLPTGSARAGIEGIVDHASAAAGQSEPFETLQNLFYALSPPLQDEFIQRVTGVRSPVKLDHVAVVVPQKTYEAVRDAVIEYSERHLSGHELSPLTVIVSDYDLAKDMHLLVEDRRKDLLYVETTSVEKARLSYRQELNIFESPRAFAALLDDMKNKDYAVFADLDGNVRLTRTAIRARLTEEEEDENPEEWNARHNSASAFCRYLPNSVAIVKSEMVKGPVTIMHGYHHATYHLSGGRYDSARGAPLPEGPIQRHDTSSHSAEQFTLAS